VRLPEHSRRTAREVAGPVISMLLQGREPGARTAVAVLAGPEGRRHETRTALEPADSGEPDQEYETSIAADPAVAQYSEARLGVGNQKTTEFLG